MSFSASQLRRALPSLWYEGAPLSCRRRLLLWICLPLSRLYGLAVRIRNRLYDHGVFRALRVPAEVVSVGNITVGGTGKTPIVIDLAGAYAAAGRKVVVISRGYGRRGRGLVLIDPAKDSWPSVEEAGEEPLLIAKAAGVPVVVEADRAKAARFACEKLSANLILLDDGFQHRRLHRDKDILVFDATRPLGNGRFFPAGPLRDTPRRIAAASLLWFTGGKEGLAPPTLPHAPRGLPWAMSAYAAEALVPLVEGAPERPLSFLRDRRVMAFAGLGRPEGFFRFLEAQGIALAGAVSFPDHHRYTFNELDGLLKEARGRQAGLLVTTEKDALNMGCALVGCDGQDFKNIYALRVSIRKLRLPKAGWLPYFL